MRFSFVPRLFYSQSVNQFKVHNSPVLYYNSNQMNPLNIVVTYLFGFMAGINCEPICRYI